MSKISTHEAPSDANKKRKRREKDEESSKKRKTSTDETEARPSRRTDAPARNRESSVISNGLASPPPEHNSPAPSPRPSAQPKTKPSTSRSKRPKSPFHVQTSSFYLPLSPICQKSPLAGLCAEHISPLILTYYEPLNGIILSYSNARLSNDPEEARGKKGPKSPRQNRDGKESDESEEDEEETQGFPPVLAEVIDEYAVTYTWVTADFLILRPERDVEIEGHVTVQSQNHIGLICWNLFNATISQDQIPEDWQWHGDHSGGARAGKNGSDQQHTSAGGYFTDENGDEVEGVIKFRVIDFESIAMSGKQKSFISIEGTLRSEHEQMDTEAQ